MIRAHHYNLVVRRYLGGDQNGNGDVPDLEEALAAYREARAARIAAEQHLDSVLAKLEEG
jgi:hypothetical protein